MERVMNHIKPKVNLLENDGNAFLIMRRVKMALNKANPDNPEIAKQYLEEATQGDYDHLLQVTMEYVEVI